MSVDQPVLGMDFKVTTKVKYSLKAKKTGKVVYEKEITADHTATMGDAFYGVERLRLANEGSAKKNIEQFLKELTNLKISKKDVSMLPGVERSVM